MTRSERIIVLLENYIDVVYGLRDEHGDGVHVPLMCKPWNRPKLGYPELERLRVRMQSERPDLYWHLREVYLTTATRRVLVCTHPRCEVTYPANVRIDFHNHGRHPVPVLPKIIRMSSPNVDVEQLGLAVEWLNEQWREPGPFLPKELQPVKVKAA